MILIDGRVGSKDLIPSAKCRNPTPPPVVLALDALRIKYPRHQVVADVWARSWPRVITFFEFPEEIRRIVYTTSAVESLHRTLRKVTKNRGSFPTQEAAIKLIYLSVQNVSERIERTPAA